MRFRIFLKLCWEVSLQLLLSMVSQTTARTRAVSAINNLCITGMDRVQVYIKKIS